jgi:acetyl esterase/lipase
MKGRYTQAFGEDPARQRDLSPITYAAAPNASRFLFINVQRQDGLAQAKALAEALRQAGAQVETQTFEGTGLRGHVEINRRLGDPDYAATPVVDRWIKAIVGR